jgi:hypothetical protein
MDVKRKAARVIAVLAVALAAGHLAQNMGNKPAAKPAASAELAKQPTKIETVAAGPETAPQSLTAKPEALAPLPAAPVAAPVAALMAPVETPVVQPPATQTSTVQACDATLDLLVEQNAMIGITLIAPCNPNQRVVLRHGGLAVTGQTTSTGALFTALPALESAGTVEASFADGTNIKGEISVPELAALRRFGVQWQSDDAFQVHAFEGGAGYGDACHVSAVDPHRPIPGLAARGGFLSLLGDATTTNPLLAEIYTFPANPGADTEVVVEAAVTDATCGRELLAETLTSTGGSVFVTDLTLAMPDCDAVGDYMVLKNLVLELNMAAAN